ncbi:MAG: C25 family cysteine peptidase [Chloroflexaceae bacterium]
MHRVLSFIVPLLLIFLFTSLSVSLPARADSDRPVRVIPQADGVRLEWEGNIAVTRSGNPAVPDWPEVEINGLRLPAQIIAFQVEDDAPVAPQIEQLESTPWSGAPARAEVRTPQTEAGDLRPALAATPTQTPPTAPVVVLREGRMRGTRIVVLAVSPIFAQNNQTRAATRVAVSLPNATPLERSATELLSRSTPFLASAPGPTNPVQSRALAQIRVAQAGMQRITGETLAAAGIDPATIDFTRLQLQHAGTAVAMEAWGSNELRFYAPEPGDRWNATDTYWLTLEASPGLRMPRRDVRPGTDPVSGRTTAVERGIWRDNQIYDTSLPGPDGDHWFAKDLRTGPGQDPATLDVPLTPTLPLVAGSTTLTITGSAYTSETHTLQVTLGTAGATATWSGAGDWVETFTLAANAPQARLTLVPGTAPSGVEPDSVAWERPVSLDFGGQGAAFVGVPGNWRYTLANTPAGRALYDLSNPRQPTRLIVPDGGGFQFDDNNSTPRPYLLAGPGMLHMPAIARHTPVDLAQPLNTDVLYLAPALLHPALAPLVAHRQAQGYTVGLVDVQAIYNNWSDGQVSPTAIRDFLRYAAATWSRPPRAVTFVGDGTADPRDYQAHGELNVNFIPPYLAMVDPWIGETSCDTCYVQLDGADPVTSADADLLPDLMMGRLPVKSTTELETLVAKILGYETATGGLDWRSRNLFIADNSYEADGTPDDAGDFARFAAESIALQPDNLRIRRLYYDPWQKDAEGNPLRDPWREADAARARERTHALLNAGAGLVNYTGHSNHWRWATTDLSEQNHLLELYEADALTNGARLPIILAMTCWTSSFQKATASGTTLDERLLLSTQGGAVAIWGPTGLGVAHGHDALQRGFYQALWNAPPMSATLGELTMAGYLELLTNSGCCQDAAQTFLLLGDPLTTARVTAAEEVYLPVVGR